jgi:type II secretory pathway pseudopilin PulG
MNRKGYILRFKFHLPLIFVSHLASHVSSKRGFTVVEFLVTILISLLILGAISVAFIGSNRGFQKNKPISQAIEEAQNSVANLDYIFSCWGVGVPSSDNTPIYIMNDNGTIKTDSYGNPIIWQPITSLSTEGANFPPENPFWYKIETDSNGYIIKFFASLYSTGYVIDDCPTASSTCKILSCRLRGKNGSSDNNGCYFIFSADGTSVKYHLLYYSKLGNNNISCLDSDLANNQTFNTTINIGGLNPGDRYQRVPHLVKIYETPINTKTSWLTFGRTDIAPDCNSSETPTYIGRIIKGSFQVIPKGQNAVELQADFVDENGSVVYKFKKVYAK